MSTPVTVCNGRLIGLITLHVDNFQGATTEGFLKNVFKTLTQIFKISKKEVEKFKFTGVDVNDSKEGGITIYQKKLPK